MRKHWVSLLHAVRTRVAAVDLDGRDAAILVGLALVWVGLRGIYEPLAPLAVGLFLLWFTTMRRVAE